MTITRGRWTAAVVLIALVTVLRVASTHTIFSATADEPVHIASGYDWVTRGVYVFDPEHPPLARGLFGLSLRLRGVDVPPPEPWTSLQPVWKASARGTELLWHGGQYVRNVAAARRGNLFFLIVAMVAVTVWARRTIGDGAALIAFILFVTLPPVLAHAGLATTDFAGVAMFASALAALEWWLDRPTWPRALLLGALSGIGLATKMSFLLFFAVAAMIVLLVRAFRGARPRASIGAAVTVAVLMLWAAYRFDTGTMRSVAPEMPRVMGELAGPRAAALAENVPLPAPAYAVGLAWVKVHDLRGHTAFLLGELRGTGWWYYFPVALFFKTPLPFLLLFVGGAAMVSYRAVRHRDTLALQHVLIPLALLAVVMPANLNIGVRHVLAVYPSMAIVAALAVRELWRMSRRSGRGAVVLLLAWQLIGTTLAHPDYLPWFNEAAGRHPERILGDSNLDWGQDLLRLVRATREEKVDSMSVLLFGNEGDLQRIGLPPHQPLVPGLPTQGWIAVSETALNFAGRENFAWLERHRPVRRVGKSIRLYYVP